MGRRVLSAIPSNGIRPSRRISPTALMTALYCNSVFSIVPALTRR